MKPEEIARLIANITRRITDMEFNRAALCALLEGAVTDEGEFRRLARDVAGTSHQSLRRWSKVHRYFDDSTIQRTRTPAHSFRSHTAWARKDGAL